MELRVDIRERQQGAVVWLELSYDGSAPPDALLADLAMIGWRVPATPPPPRDAIDWASAGAEAGAQHQVRPWQVTGLVAESPPGNGPRGTWTIDERRVFLLSLDGVLRRHGVHDADEHDGPTVVQPLPATPAAPTLVSDDLGNDLARITMVMAMPRRSLVEDELADLDVSSVRWERATITTTERYRGSSYESQTAALRLIVTLGIGNVVAITKQLCATAGLELGDDAVSVEIADLPGAPSSGSVPELRLVRNTARSA